MYGWVRGWMGGGGDGGWYSHLKLVVHKEWFKPSGDTAHILKPGVHTGGVAAEHFLGEAGNNIRYDLRRVLCAGVVIRQDHPVGLQQKGMCQTLKKVIPKRSERVSVAG